MEKTPDKTKAQPPKNQASRIVRALSAGKQIVITVSRRPSIDQMVAAIGLASLINRQSTSVQPPTKNGTEIQVKTQLEPLDTKPDSRTTRNAVVAFAGQIHPKIGFLQTDKIITKTVDNYRELVVAIDKKKADKLRYSLDKKMARVHISPFLNNQGGLSVKDLEIGPGDFNIDVLVSVGVNEVSDLEPMIGDHIEMLKNRQTITLMAGQTTPSQIFGAEEAAGKPEKSATKLNTRDIGDKKFKSQPINWCQTQACCLSEMVFDLAKEMRFEIDETVATIILTGFFAATERVRSRSAAAEQIEMISRLVKVAGIDNKQMIIDYLENEKLQLAELATEPAKRTVLATKSTRSQLLTEQEATKQIRSADTDLAAARSGLGLRVSDERRVAKSTEKEEDTMIRDLDDVQVDESGNIIHGAVGRPAEELAKPEPVAVASAGQPAIDPTKTIPVANPITDADKLGQQSPAPAAISPAATTPSPPPASQFQPSLIPTPNLNTQKDNAPNADLATTGQPAT